MRRNTAFRWRRRLLALPKIDRPQHFDGITAAEGIYLFEPEKGARHLDRLSHKCGGPAKKRGLSFDQVCLLVAGDRTGQILDFVTRKGAVTKAQLKRCLPRVIDEDVLLIQISHRDIGASLRGLFLFVKTHKAMSRAPYLDKATASTTRLLII
jgi:hypothetical protein